LGQDLADLGMDFDVGPFADEIEMVGIGDVAAKDAVLHLCRRFVHRVRVGVVELVEETDELLTAAGLHPEIIDVQEMALLGQGLERHPILLRNRSLGRGYPPGKPCATGKAGYTEQSFQGGPEMPDSGPSGVAPRDAVPSELVWPAEGLSRIPDWV